MRAMVLAEPARARLFDRSGGRDKEVELRKFPGLIWNDQKTKFNICVDCCEVIFQKTLPTLKKHQCKTKTDILREKDIEIIETRSKFHNLNYLFAFNVIIRRATPSFLCNFICHSNCSFQHPCVL